MPVEAAPLSPSEDAAVGRVCPALTVSAPEGTHSGVWGPVRQVCQGHSTDHDLRHRGSSGGALTALARHLLDSGSVDTVVCTVASGDDPLLNVPLVASDAGELIRSAGSRYAPAAPLAGLFDVKVGDRVAFIGKPCDVAAARALQAGGHLPSLELSLCLSFLCAGTPSIDGTTATLAAMGVQREEVKEFRYRGNGWPGTACAVTPSGPSELSYDESWGGHLGPRVHERCKYCADGIGLSADVVFGDAWRLKDGQPSFVEAPGESLVFVRTASGQAAVADAVTAGALVLADFAIGTLEQIQPYQAHRRRYIGARLLGLAVVGRVRPRYAKTVLVPRSERHIERVRWLREFAGTLKRIVRAWPR